MDGSAFWPGKRETMQRYFTDEKLSIGEIFKASADDTHHMKNVMRFRPGDAFHMVDGSRDTFLCEITSAGETVECRPLELVEEAPELPVDLTVYCPLLKGEKFDWMIQKATELGAHAFSIYDADRSIVKLDEKKRRKRIERYMKIIREASEQSRRQHIPEIGFVPAVKELSLDAFDHVLFAYEGNASNPAASLHETLQALRGGDRIAFIFGPEGGFSEAETEALSSHNSIRLGPRILRAETAPLYALSAISATFE
ncbi:RsmE family RNA methyltransferase [Salinicoccus roseus]|uniref:RsmE family RNA methyltransferase n=1 Tax=Salinicoccus roseus TaxID=45670 RepID=UPI002300B86D|nr:RsmE family RNA methyltransferase [Salinicoccus roseus]